MLLTCTVAVVSFRGVYAAYGFGVEGDAVEARYMVNAGSGVSTMSK
jgi:hypothetical protein